MSHPLLKRSKELAERATPGKWYLDYAGHAENCRQAVIQIDTDEGRQMYQVWIDHRKDFTDPAPDANYIAFHSPKTIKAMVVALEMAMEYIDLCDDKHGIKVDTKITALLDAAMEEK